MTTLILNTKLPYLDPVTVAIAPRPADVANVLCGKTSQDTLQLTLAQQHRNAFATAMQCPSPNLPEALDSLLEWERVLRAINSTRSAITSKKPLLFTWSDGPLEGRFKEYTHTALPFEVAMVTAACGVVRVGVAANILRDGLSARDSARMIVCFLPPKP